MKDKVKEYVKYELNNISKGFDGSLALERAYGAVTFVLYCDWDEELSNWWSDEMLPKFEEARVEQERRKSKAWKKEKSTAQ